MEHKYSSLLRYNAFEVPADKYVLQKTINYGQIGGTIGFFTGIGSHLASKAPSTPAFTLVRIATHVGVVAASGIAYGTMLSVLGTIRGKDDAKNHFYAAFIAGAIPGSMFKANPIAGVFYTGFLFGLTACLIKLSYIQHGGKRRIGNLGLVRNRKQLSPYKIDVETKPEYAKYFI